MCAVGLAVLLGAFSAFSQAASLRCDKALLHEGAHMYEVSQLCGAPAAEFSRLEFLHPDVPVYVDEWIYRLGKNKFERMLRFENGRLRNIRTLRKPVTRSEAFSRDSASRRGGFSGNDSADTGTVHRISW